ncbi:nitrogen assimilation transcription factor nirA [Purpureocillium lavendulum]|uniref:Nitrogen assimilation transcription factor nirA n=1 Tax=Purpureocillium lavendulum TaxID=1247861 RepID=A0AB34G0R1_9HYPO|nr:nitrogen assimilation transcription factor nirA [Purpureocillium lavendulum]
MAGTGSRAMSQPGLSEAQPPPAHTSIATTSAGAAASSTGATKKPRRAPESSASQKRRCISTACIACRKRKSKCDGAIPSCAACASVYGTECIYDPNSDHRRKGVYREKVDSMKARNSTLQILVEAILNASEDDVPTIVRRIRACDSLDSVAQQIATSAPDSGAVTPEQTDEEYTLGVVPVEGEKELARKMGELRLENGYERFIGGTSHLIYHGEPADTPDLEGQPEQYPPSDNPIASWTRVTADPTLITHLINMYFNYHYAYFTTLSKKLFWRDFLKGREGLESTSTPHCSPLLVNAMLALGCHFTDVPGAYATPGDSKTKGDHFFAEAKRLILVNDEFAMPRLATVQALALMSVREAGCARESKGWVYSGMSFRMAQDLGLNLEVCGTTRRRMSDEEVDARKITYWGCFVFDKCWSNYMGRLPQLPRNGSNVSKFDVFPDEDAAAWSPLTDKGYDETYEQPWRTRAAALQLASLSEISSELLIFFYHPNHIGRSRGKSAELKKLSELHQRLEEWRKQIPNEFEPKEGQLPNVILMQYVANHLPKETSSLLTRCSMFFHLQYIHLFRPFLKYSPSASPLPAHVSPRRICTANAGAISKLMRLYKKTYNLRQICNIAVYMIHSACTIHLLNLPEKTARRDIIHGVRHLEEIAEDWLCARRTLSILSVLARKWRCELPEDAAFVLKRTDEKYGFFSTSDVPSPTSSPHTSPLLADDASVSTSQRDYSPISQYAQAHMGHATLPSASIDDQMAMMPPLEAVAGVPAVSQPQTTQDMQFESERLELSPDLLEGWTRQATGTPQSSFGTSFMPVNAEGILSNNGNQAGARQVAPGQGFGISGQRWIINDSARWQQNFDGWELAGSVPNSSLFLFGDQSRSNSIQSPSEATDQRRGGFEGLATSLSGGGWLQGLD